MTATLVTKTVTNARTPPAWVNAPRRCLGCGRDLEPDPEDGGPERHTCSDACRMAVHRARKRLTPLLRFLARVVEGAPTREAPPFAELIRQIWRHERVVAAYEVKASRLPGSSR